MSISRSKRLIRILPALLQNRPDFMSYEIWHNKFLLQAFFFVRGQPPLASWCKPLLSANQYTSAIVVNVTIQFDILHCLIRTENPFWRDDVSDTGCLAVIKEDASEDGDTASLRNVVFLDWAYNGEYEHTMNLHWYTGEILVGVSQ